MLNSPIILGGIYLVAAFVFSFAYYFAWRANSDSFIVHQEMNLRPLAGWKVLGVRLRRGTSSAAQTDADSIDKVHQKYSALATDESTLQDQLDAVAPQLEQASKEVQRLGPLHEKARLDNVARMQKEERERQEGQMKRILGEFKQSLEKAPGRIDEASIAADKAAADIPQITTDELFSRAAATSYLADLDTAIASERTLTARSHDLEAKLTANRSAQRELLQAWDSRRSTRLIYFDFLYFSMGVATSNTFGDLLPNDRVVRGVIILQLLLSLTLVGMFLNSLQ